MLSGLKRGAYLLLSFLAVVQAQPDISPFACFIAATFGYALFFKGVLLFETKKSRFFIAALWFGSANFAHISWFASDHYVGTFIYFFLLFLFLLFGSCFGLLTLLIPKERKITVFESLALASLWTLSEWGRLFVISGFSWDPIGLALTANPYSLQLASTFGTFGLTFWVLFTNFLCLQLLNAPWNFSELFRYLFVVCLPFIFGQATIKFHEKATQRHAREPLDVLLVQTALTPEEKAPFPNSQAQVLDPLDQWKRILTFLKPHIDKKIDLIVMSEGAVPYGADLPIYSKEEVEAAFKEVLNVDFDPGHKMVGNAAFGEGIATIFNAATIVGLDHVKRGSKEAYNSAFVFRPNSSTRERYDKRILVPMGEYIPFSFCKKFLEKYGITDSFLPGKEAKIFRTDKSAFGLSICYEETYGNLMLENKKNGAELLINLTNDAWYPASRLPLVHFMHGRIRAVEGGLPLIRSCNTGVTGGVDSLGRTLGMLPYESKHTEAQGAALHLKVPRYTWHTLYCFIGDAGIMFIASIFAFCYLSSKILNYNSLYLELLRKK